MNGVVANTAQAHDAVLQSLHTGAGVEGAAAALWNFEGGWCDGLSDRNHNVIDSAVDAVMP